MFSTCLNISACECRVVYNVDWRACWVKPFLYSSKSSTAVIRTQQLFPALPESFSTQFSIECLCIVFYTRMHCLLQYMLFFLQDKPWDLSFSQLMKATVLIHSSSATILSWVLLQSFQISVNPGKKGKNTWQMSSQLIASCIRSHALIHFYGEFVIANRHANMLFGKKLKNLPENHTDTLRTCKTADWQVHDQALELSSSSTRPKCFWL